MPVLDSSLWKRSIKDLLVELLRDNTDEFLVLVGGKETSDNDSSSAIESAPVNFSFFFFLPKIEPTLDFSFEGFFGDADFSSLANELFLLCLLFGTAAGARC